MVITYREQLSQDSLRNDSGIDELLIVLQPTRECAVEVPDDTPQLELDELDARMGVLGFVKYAVV